MRWINQQHIRKLSHEKLWQEIKPFLDNANLNLPSDKSWQDKSLELFAQNLEVLHDAVELYTPLAENTFEISDEAKDVPILGQN